MRIETTFDIGQTVFSVEVGRVLEEMTCPRCNGLGHLIAVTEEGSKHKIDCPASVYDRTKRDPEEGRCRHGKVKVGFRHSVTDIAELTVGQIRVSVGGISGNTNVGGGAHNQTFERKEVVMFYETGIGSGNLWDVGGRTYGNSAWNLCATREEAEAWGAETVTAMDDAMAAEATEAK